MADHNGGYGQERPSRADDHACNGRAPPEDPPPNFHVILVGFRPEFRKQGAAVEILRALGH